jgi:bacterioferritin
MNGNDASPADTGTRLLSIHKLNRALATELVCMFRYQRHCDLSRGIYTPAQHARLQEQAHEESLHAQVIADRIVELGGVPDLQLDTLEERSFVPWTAAGCDEVLLPSLLADDLVAERIATDAYRELIEDLRERDPLTCELLSRLVAAEEGHAAGMARLLEA